MMMMRIIVSTDSEQTTFNFLLYPLWIMSYDLTRHTIIYLNTAPQGKKATSMKVNGNADNSTVVVQTQPNATEEYMTIWICMRLRASQLPRLNQDSRAW
jgi:hypothetical protein